ncbi:sulfite oxidase [Mycolicibacterium sp. S2-37]|uniref:sulfite oxidase n=1 Tax=Mycolicibacterium sp. S2-37 TaxID=2810297 RepID=UPI001A93C5F7|nr:sulfite oxidase [Mycolicibacterium sp. S2-37]MBO0676301.1 sulfite oxidase [Mycolicibacterium sp. S2-37]
MPAPITTTLGMTRPLPVSGAWLLRDTQRYVHYATMIIHPIGASRKADTHAHPGPINTVVAFRRFALPPARPSRQSVLMTEATVGVVKSTSPDLLEDTGSGLDYGTTPEHVLGEITPIDRFFIRSHAPTPLIDAAAWSLRIEGDGVEEPVEYRYEDICTTFEHVTVRRTIECAGNRRVLFGEELGQTFEGTQWGRTAISTAEWTGVRLRDLLEPARVTAAALEVMPESLDEIRARRPLPLQKALAPDTIVAIAMNGEALPPDHGFPARLVVSGWLGAASIKWLGRIEVAERAIQVPWNTEDYVLIGPEYPGHGAARGAAITEPALSTLIDLPWPARLASRPQIIRGRAFAGEATVTEVHVRVDDGPWQSATITSPGGPGLWARWQFRWHPEPGEHEIRVRATDDRGRTQPETTPWNELGYMHRSILAHPVHVVDAEPVV